MSFSQEYEECSTGESVVPSSIVFVIPSFDCSLPIASLVIAPPSMIVVGRLSSPHSFAPTIVVCISMGGHPPLFPLPYGSSTNSIGWSVVSKRRKCPSFSSLLFHLF